MNSGVPAHPSKSFAEPDLKLGAQEIEQLLRLQKDILEAVALGNNHQTILNQLCVSAEAMVSHSVASIMLYNDDHTCLNVVAAPSLTRGAIDALNGLVPGVQSGSCGTAVFTEAPTIVRDTRSDIRWASFEDFICNTGIGACWSIPVKTNDDEVLGSFALSSFEKRSPTPFQYHLLETGASLASISIKRQREEALLYKAAYHDVLTGLPNRSMFTDQFKRTMDRAERNGTGMALMFIDLDRFKDINDTQGHKTGDRVLQSITAVMTRHTRKSDLIARFGGDEFMLLIDDIDDVYEISLIAEKMLAAIAEPVVLDNREYAMTASIGISLFPGDGTNQGILLQRADTAMYEAKARGRSGYCFYEPALTELVDDRLELEAALRCGIQKHEFILHYQPIYASSSSKIDTVEVLARWDSPSLGMVEPSRFIPVAEETSIIKVLGLQILEMACTQCMDWWNTGLPPFRLAVNVSAGQLDGGFYNHLQRILKQTGFPAERLEIEVTESMIMDSQKFAIDELYNIRTLGVGVSMDDFGTGHSSLAQLKRLPITKLKIDRSFVSDIPDDPNDMIIAKTIIAMGQSLGLQVVAEGVTTSEQEDFLIQEGCDLLQGFLLNKPMAANKFQQLLTESKQPIIQ